VGILDRCRTVRGRSFKHWLFDTYGIELRHLPQIKEAVFRTRGRNLPLGAELVAAVERVLEAATALAGCPAAEVRRRRRSSAPDRYLAGRC
jgi:hypothetical protein